MQYTQRFTENYQLAGARIPMTGSAGQTWPITQGGLYVSMANHQRAVFLLGTGAMGAGATLDFQVWQATSAAGANAKIVGGKAITQLSQAAGDASDAVAIELRTEELDVDGGFSYVMGFFIIGTNTVTFTGMLLLGGTNQAPVPVGNWTEIVD
jgi:hypothetical protein